LSLQVLITHLDKDIRTSFRKLRFHVSHTDPLLQYRRHRTGSNHANYIPFRIGDLIAMTGNSLFLQLESTQLTGYALFLLTLQFRTIRKVLTLGELRDPA